MPHQVCHTIITKGQKAALVIWLCVMVEDSEDLHWGLDFSLIIQEPTKSALIIISMLNKHGLDLLQHTS